jgi:hypothetical protein
MLNVRRERARSLPNIPYGKGRAPATAPQLAGFDLALMLRYKASEYWPETLLDGALRAPLRQG